MVPWCPAGRDLFAGGLEEEGHRRGRGWGVSERRVLQGPGGQARLQPHPLARGAEGGGRKTPGQSAGTEPEGRIDRARALLTRSPQSTRGAPHTLGPATVLAE